MPNAFSKSDIVFFEQVIAGFENNNVVAKNTAIYTPNMEQMEQSGLTVKRPMPMISTSSSGRDVSSDYKDITQLVVPSTLAESDILNVPFKMNAVELNDPQRRDQKAMSAARQLSAQLDKAVATRVANYGSQVVVSANDMDTYAELSVAEAVLMEQGVSESMQRAMFLNPRDAAKVASGLASRQTLQGRPLTAYERSALPPIAGFDTFRGNILPTIAASAESAATVNGANQHHTPLKDIDNRFQTLTVNNTTLANGDAFTMAGVFAVNMETKQSTGQLQTFRVVAGGGTTSLTITPAIIPADGSAQAQKEYANVTTTPASGAAIVALNIAAKMSSIFFCREAVEIIHGRLAVDDLQGGGVSVMRERTDSGIEIIFAKESGIDALETKYRLTMWAAANVLQPQMAGILLGNQT